jgi:hypothetical protein
LPIRDCNVAHRQAYVQKRLEMCQFMIRLLVNSSANVIMTKQKCSKVLINQDEKGTCGGVQC